MNMSYQYLNKKDICAMPRANKFATNTSLGNIFTSFV